MTLLEQPTALNTHSTKVLIPYDVYKSYYIDPRYDAEFLWCETRDEFRFDRDNKECPYPISRKEKIRVETFVVTHTEDIT